MNIYMTYYKVNEHFFVSFQFSSRRGPAERMILRKLILLGVLALAVSFYTHFIILKETLSLYSMLKETLSRYSMLKETLSRHSIAIAMVKPINYKHVLYIFRMKSIAHCSVKIKIKKH